MWNSTYLNKPILVEDIESALKQLKNNKFSGEDGIYWDIKL